MRVIPSIVVLTLLGCGAGYRADEYQSTERTYTIEHGQASQLDAFDQVEEWISLTWHSAPNVIDLKNERTGTFVIKWLTEWQDPFFGPRNARSTALVKVDPDRIAFTLMSNVIPSNARDAVHREWDRLMLQTPWGPATNMGAGRPARKSEAPACRGDRDCERGEVCSSEGQCVSE